MFKNSPKVIKLPKKRCTFKPHPPARLPSLNTWGFLKSCPFGTSVIILFLIRENKVYGMRKLGFKPRNEMSK